MELDLRGKRAVVTGGGGSIGGAIARGLASEGAEVAIWDLAQEAAEVARASVRAAGVRSVAARCDVTDTASIASALEATLRELGGIELLVNSAGGSRAATTTAPDLSFFDLLPEEMRRTVDLNYLSTVMVSQQVGRVMAGSGQGAILNIGSVAGILPLSRSVSYSDAKAAVSSFTRWLAVHLAETCSRRIRVNAVAPGFILTAQNRFLLETPEGKPTERASRVLAAVPMARLGTPEEIVPAALWLLSDRASFVTGAVVPVDGGFTAYAGV